MGRHREWNLIIITQSSFSFSHFIVSCGCSHSTHLNIGLMFSSIALMMATMNYTAGYSCCCEDPLFSIGTGPIAYFSKENATELKLFQFWV